MGGGRSRALCGARRLLALVALAASASARTPELPSAFAGRLSVEVLTCRPLGSLREARVRLRTEETEVRIAELHCGAFGSAGDALFLTRVAGATRVPAHTARDFVARFPADAQHAECGCALSSARDLAADARARPFSDPDAAEPAFLPEVAEQEIAPAPAEPDPAPPGLRFERVLVPSLGLRPAPQASEPQQRALAPGERIAVDRIEAGWKLARTRDGGAGWLPDEAATADLAAPERVAELLAPLEAAVLAGGPRPAGFCGALDRRELGELVYAWQPEAQSVLLRPLWYALPPARQDAFQTWAAECYGATHLIESMRNLEIR